MNAKDGRGTQEEGEPIGKRYDVKATSVAGEKLLPEVKLCELRSLRWPQAVPRDGGGKRKGAKPET